MSALANVGYAVSDQTVENVLKRHGIALASKRLQNTTWKEFIQSHLAVLAGIDLCTAPYLARAGDVLPVVLHSSGEPAGQLGRHYAAPKPGVDATDSTQRDRGGVWDSSISGVTHCMIATRSSARCSGRRYRLAA